MRGGPIDSKKVVKKAGKSMKIEKLAMQNGK
jgi:hypothetical protein